MATADLTRAGLVLAPRARRARWPVLAALLLTAFALGGGASWLYWQPLFEASQQQSNTLREQRQLQQRFDEAQMLLRVAASRTKELERQIDSLNQRLRESEEQLGFFRKAREGKR